MKLKRSDIAAFTREILKEYIKPAKESDVDPLELKKGISVEMEHTKDPKKAKVIALQHLAEDPRYYTKLSKVGLEEKVKGIDGKACWKGYRYAGTEDGKDKCVKVSVNERLGPGIIGPFFHETDLENVQGITEKGIQARRDYISLSPGERTGHYGEAVFEVYLTPQQFQRAVEETLDWIGSDMKEQDVLEIEEILDGDIMEMIILANERIQDPFFMLGELICPFSIPANQIKLVQGKLNEEQSTDKTIIYPDFQGSDIAENIHGDVTTLKVSDCIGNEPGKDLNYFNTEKKSYVEKIIKSAKQKDIESLPPIIAVNHPLLPGKYLVLDGNHRLGAFKIGGISEIKAIILNNSDIVLATPETEWEEGIVPETITVEDAKSKGIDLRRYFNTEELSENIHNPVRPGILKRQIKGKVTCSKAKALKAAQKDKSNNTAKAAQRFINYHDC